MKAAAVEVLVRGLVEQPDAVRVDEAQEGDVRLLRLHVAPMDRGRIVGDQGRVIEALRTLIEGISGHHGRRCTLELEG